jgi:protein O-GlcNAc transferase
MKRIITFSLWGNNPTYNIGAIKNAELASQYYPDFECWFYIHIPTVPINTIEILRKMSNTKIIDKYDDLNNCKPLCWRFQGIDDPDVEIMMSRDTDTRILLREKIAVDKWLQSGKMFHIMRDHPHHQNQNNKIMAGMFDTKKILGINWTELCNNINQTLHSNYDQVMLNNYIYPLIKNDLIVHSSFSLYSGEYGFKFPIPYDSDYRFVGEYVYADESRSIYHINELRKYLK